MQRVQAVCQECSLDECNSVEDYEVPVTPCIEFITQSGRSDDPVRYEVCGKHLGMAFGMLNVPEDCDLSKVTISVNLPIVENGAVPDDYGQIWSTPDYPRKPS